MRYTRSQRAVQRLATEDSPSTSSRPPIPDPIEPPPLEHPSNAPIFFWKSTGPHGYLCQWHPSYFTTNSLTFNCAEQYMMYRKAILASDTASAAKILAEKLPRKQKALGRSVKNLDLEVYDCCKFHIVTEGNWLKFSQDEGLRNELLETGERELVEASPMDWIWGIGFAAEHAETLREEWGQNLLGKALVTVRDRLRAGESGME